MFITLFVFFGIRVYRCTREDRCKLIIQRSRNNRKIALGVVCKQLLVVISCKIKLAAVKVPFHHWTVLL